MGVRVSAAVGRRGVQQAFAQHRADIADRHGHGVQALNAGVVDEHRGLELPGADQPAPGFLGEGRFALPAKAGDRDPPRRAGKPAFDFPEFARARPKKPASGRGREVQ